MSRIPVIKCTCDMVFWLVPYPCPGKHSLFVLSYFLCLRSSMKFGPVILLDKPCFDVLWEEVVFLRVRALILEPPTLSEKPTIRDVM